MNTSTNVWVYPYYHGNIPVILLKATISLPKRKNRFMPFRQNMHFRLHNYQQDSVMLYCLTVYLRFRNQWSSLLNRRLPTRLRPYAKWILVKRVDCSLTSGLLMELCLLASMVSHLPLAGFSCDYNTARRCQNLSVREHFQDIQRLTLKVVFAA